MSSPFFNEITEQSEVKSLLVSKYFWAWAQVMASTQKRYPQRSQRIAYIDLFAGPGRYKDGQISTPVLILKKAVTDLDICKRLVTIFNDKDEDNVNSLRDAIQDIPSIENLKHDPVIMNLEVGEDIVKQFEETKLVPTFFFVDPWGYKGLSLRLVNSVVKDFGCDAIFFFNYNRINMGLNNEAVAAHMDALFGVQRAAQLRQQLEVLSPTERELLIVNEISAALSSMGARYVLPFTFKNSEGTRTSHHLIFVSKHVKGYEIMKEIMARHSSRIEQGVASFDFNPVANRQLTFLYELSRPLDELGDHLLRTFKGQTLTVTEVYERHHVGKPYILSNYKQALCSLEEQGKVTCRPLASERKMWKGKRVMPETVRISFAK